MKKGFTLIELLAVIVILAIIALIATPIILGIINDAREESNERSVELYASAVRNGIAAYQLREGKEVLPGTYNETNKLPFEPEYDGKVDCENVIISETGKVSLDKCTVNDGTKEYSYGIEEDETTTPESTQVYKPQYYYFGLDWYGTVGTTAAPAESERLTVPPTGEIRYLGYDVTDGVVSAAYSCFKIEVNDTEYCLKGEQQEEKKAATYEANKTVLLEAFGENACSFGGDYSFCGANDLAVGAHVYSRGDVLADDGSVYCSVSSGGRFECPEP